VCVRILIEVSAHTCMNICVCTVFFLKKYEMYILNFVSCNALPTCMHMTYCLSLLLAS
jgi:hypothetical protein